MIKPVLRYIWLVPAIFLMGACNLGKWVPEGEYRLYNNEIYVDGEDAPSKVNNILKQQPAPVTENLIYSWGNPTKEKGFSRWVSDQGTPPTIFSPTLADRTRNQLALYYFSKGYFLNRASYELNADTNRRKIEVIYHVKLGPRYYINDIKFEIASSPIDSLVRSDSASMLFGKGDPYDELILENERDRLATRFRNLGFYGFSKDLIRYSADTSAGDHRVNLTMRILDRPIRTEDSTYTVPHERWTMGEVYIDYGFNYLNPEVSYADSLTYRNYNFLIRDKPKYHPHLITRAIHFGEDENYNAEKVRNSYTHLSSLGVFGATEIELKPRSDTGSHILDSYIRLTPLPKRSFTTRIEGTNTSGNYGIAGNLSWLNRNLFGAGEILDVTLKGGIQAQINTLTDGALFNTYELGAEIGLTFSRFLIPLRYQELFPKDMRPTTRISTSYSQQIRVEFQRRIYKLGLAYQWQFSESESMQLTIPDFNYVNLLDADPRYLDSLFFKTGFQDNLIAAARFTYTYNPIDKISSIHRFFFRGSAESSGNMFLNAADFAFPFPKDPETGASLIFNVPYAQYVKFDVEGRYYLRTSPKSMIVARAFAGITYNNVDGNSPFLPPFEKNFLAGGSQDIRAWIAYRLGPGALPHYVYSRQKYAAVAPFKLMINLEYRFPILGSLNGAIFGDAGNVWLFDREYPISDFNGLEQIQLEKMKFRPNTFLRQSAVGTGFGLRYDFGFFQLRLDGGMKVWDPGQASGKQFVLDGLRWENVTYNFALGYPF